MLSRSGARPRGRRVPRGPLSGLGSHATARRALAGAALALAVLWCAVGVGWFAATRPPDPAETRWMPRGGWDSALRVASQRRYRALSRSECGGELTYGAVDPC